MLAVCYRYVKSLSDAEDILQEGFIKVFTKLHQFKRKGELGAWIRRIMVNTAISYLQKHNRYRDELQLENVAIHSVNDNAAEVLLDAKDIIKLICELPVSYQTVFNLVAIEGYSHVEISKMLGINENTIRSQYNRARALLIHKIKILNGGTEKENYG
jgi:RNA polymerase sigma-70 factor (ECF subfamily)